MADGYSYAGSASGCNPPLTLSHPWPRMTAKGRERVEGCLAAGCGSTDCSATTATLTKRKSRGTQAVSAQLQCDDCGRSLSGAIGRADCFTWQDFPEFRQELLDAQQARWDARREANNAEWENRIATAEVMRARRAAEIEGYLEWCRTSPEWHAISSLVMWRSRGRCEACLDAPAEVVHHLTYEFGRLPPAWDLRAVCRACHDRLHADKRGGSDEWCAC